MNPISTTSSQHTPSNYPARRRGSLRRLLAIAVAIASIGAAGVSIASPANAIVITSTCRQDCISTVTIRPAGVSAEIGVTTTVPTKVSVIATPDGSGASAKGSSNTFKTSHGISLTGLQLSKAYQVKISARDQGGNVHSETRSFRTLTRRLTITVEKIRLLDDSDAVGAGEIWMHGRVVGAGGYYKFFPNLVENADWATGPWHYVGKKLVVDNPPAGARLDLQVADADGCTPPPSFDIVDDGCYESAVTPIYPQYSDATTLAWDSVTKRGYGGVDFEVVVKYSLTFV